MVHFDISRVESVEAVKLAMASNQYLYVVTQKETENSQNPDGLELHRVGCVVKVQQMVKLSKNMVRVMVEGMHRAELLHIDTDNGIMKAELEVWIDEELSDESNEAYCRSLMEEVRICYESGMKINLAVLQKLKKTRKAAELIDNLAEKLPISYEKRQMILEVEDVPERVAAMLQLLHTEGIVGQIRAKLQTELKSVVEKNQREYVLREQQKLIQEELGDSDVSDAEEYKKKLEALQAPEEVMEKLKKEIKRFEAIPVTSSESAVSRTYIETLLEYPWSRQTKDNQDIAGAEVILNQDHYGLEKVKERILDFLAVRSMVSEGDSPILCLVGPPGTGKTSVARSIARAVNKEYIRISLGGIRDEAEIRGHRKTYVGAMPGRIAAAMMKVQVNNPLILLDEIDKMSNDFKGDPSSAMLEVLDSEQNCKFIDHYFEVPIDLSQVSFIATANDISGIPKPLLDRMEVIEVSSYTENEKFHIAKEFLVEKQRKKHGLKAKQLQISEDAIYALIRGYTREAGVRSLERQIAALCRKADRMIVSGEKKSCRVTAGNLENYLGIKKYEENDWNLEPEVGVATGLAWTSVGGDTLKIEVMLLPGNGAVELTGNLGDVMKESAQLAVTYVKSRIARNLWKDKDVHIHVPEGAVPKDGPSAGITMATAVYSAVRKLKVRGDVAMTGEITLRGHVLPIGGLKEKLLAAKNSGMKEVLVPARNRKDVSELSAEITEGMLITYVDTMEDVWKRAIIM
jgi:ATP-dependent Lon protease